uniref:BAI1-associated protein 3 n=1 Tax=Denticeps clupeoides TaxID=299321 RepID=A0AAY4CR23_9TELE
MLKCIGRYFKQIAKSVRANGAAGSGGEENADDFLGCLNIPLNEIPVVGYDKWFKLEPRSSASKVQGECHLILRLFSSQRDTTLSKRESNVNIHKKILSQILEYEHSHIQVEPYNWNGQVSPPAWTVLSHHAAQADLSPLQQAIIRWQCYSSHHRSQRMCYSLLLRLLRTIDAEWDSAAVHGELGSHLADSFGSYIEYCLGLIKNMRQVFPCSNSAAVIRCELMLSVLSVYSFRLRYVWGPAHSLKAVLKEVEQQVKHSSSAMDVIAYFCQVRELWAQLAWPDSSGAFIFITRLTDVSAPHPRWTLKRYIQHISLSPDSINNDEAVSPLMKYLDNTLVILSESLVKENLSRVLQSLWEVVLRMIQDTVAENRGVQAEFYTRFQYTVEALVQFFHAEGEGLALENLKSGDYKVLEEELRLNKCSSFELIEQYFLEKISQQRILKHSKFGRVSVKCYYDAPEQRLTVEILHAADLIALDANGLSDPFVIVELCPHHLFPMAKSQRTQVKLKTLHPVFDEFFYFHVSPEQYRHRCACLTFTVMDYDWLSTNDFAGEAVAPLSDFCWPGRPNATPAGKTVQPFILHLSRQKPSGRVPSVPERMLEARTGEREAQEFVRRLKEIEKSMEEE